MRYKLVPVEPTDEMLHAALNAPYGKPWSAGIAAAPKASEDEALVEKLIETLAQVSASDYSTQARAVLKMLEGSGQ